ncbi:MAG: hypothetical protein GQF41_3189 [Candidatus Rifleibacterium amylolyticum]|nr:MAG: hypothetical protein GQF41_3189 [Candidatus Rifleibacterium amylolyticum]
MTTDGIGDRTLRLLIAVIFAVLVFLPLLFVSHDLNNLAALRYNQELEDARLKLIDEVNSCKDELVPRLYIEKLAKAGDAHIGLVSETADKPVFQKNVDPQLITASTNAQLRSFYQQQAGLEPLIQVAFAVDCRQIWSWYSPQMPALSVQEREIIDLTLAHYAADKDLCEPVMQSDPLALNNYYRTLQIAKRNYSGISTAMQATLYQHFSDLSFTQNNQGVCYEMAANRFGSRNLYCYYRAIKDGKSFYGGYFVIFASAGLKSSDILEAAKKPSSKDFQRSFSAESSFQLNCIEQDGDKLQLTSLLPTELAGFNRVTGSLSALPRYLTVSLSIRDINQVYRKSLLQIAAVGRMTALATFLLMTYFVLFGFPGILRLRLRMLTVIALVLLIPYFLLGYFCLGLLNSIQNLEKHELKAEGESLMYRVRNYFIDQKLQMVLHMLKSKHRLAHAMQRSGDEILQMNVHDVLNAGSFADMTFFRDDGTARNFRDRDVANSKIAMIDSLLSVKYLDNLGVLQRQEPRVKKLLEQVVLADGFISTLKRDYYEHYIMQNEAVESADVRKVDNFARMIYYLIPDAAQAGLPVRAMAMTNISNSGYMMINPQNFTPEIYSETTGRARHHFALGQRRIDDTVLRWWPEYLSPDSRLRQLLDNALTRRSNGFRVRSQNGRLEFEHYRFEKDQPVVISGVSQSMPDLMLHLLVRSFPLLMFALVFLSLFLFADVLAVLFIVPVKGFQQAAAQIGRGNLQTRVEIARTDEFALLADSFNRMGTGLQQREKIRRFVSEDLYQQLGQRTVAETPRLERVSMLASDIRGFTSLSEKTDPQLVVSLLNDYFTEMEAAITSCGGFVERLVGDAVVAVFYHAEGRSCEQQAVLAAWQMRARLAQLNARRAVAGLFTVDNGIGIASGRVFAGIAGAKSGRRIYSVIGEVVQLAEEIESLTRTVPSRILLCSATAARLDERYKLSEVSGPTGVRAFALVACEVADV